jgi:flagellin-like protein
MEQRKMKKLFRSRKALSPVVAAIILVAVTVAVAIAVEVSELTITHLDFTVGDTETGKVIVYVTNSGTSDVTVYRIRVNGENEGTWSSETSNQVTAGTSEVFTVTRVVAQATKYSVILYTIDGTMVGSYTDTA